MNAFKEHQLDPGTIAKLEANAGHYWDSFYQFHTDQFFKDRHWFSNEFPALLTASSVLEVGCGVGNTIFPLLEINPNCHVYACDFAATAINIVQQHPEYTNSKRVTAFVADLIATDLAAQHVSRGIVDVCTMVFVLSAIPPKHMPVAIANVARCLVPGRGQVLFRDYGSGDLAEERLQGGGRQQKIKDSFYIRGDRTMAYYFSEEFVRQVFVDAGFRCEELTSLKKVKVNRGTGLKMERKFIQGVFTLIDTSGLETWEPVQHNGGAEREGSLESDGDGNDDAFDLESNRTTLQHVEVVLGPMRLNLELPESNSQLNSVSAAMALAQIVLHCPILFSDINVVEVNCGAAALPSLAALRWCRRTVLIDCRGRNLEILRRNARRNGCQFAYERLRLAVDRSSEAAPGWVDGAFRGPIGAVLAAVEDDNDLLVNLSEVMASISRILPQNGASSGAFAVVAVLRGDGNSSKVLEDRAVQHGFRVCKPFKELEKAISEVSVGSHAIVFMQRA